MVKRSIYKSIIIKECSIPLLMDELRIYNRPLEDYEIEAEAEPALGGIEPSYI